jgi:NADH-quinone oxidoreductase subunit G
MQNERIARVTPRENPAVNGPWICNKAATCPSIFERARAEPMLKGARWRSRRRSRGPRLIAARKPGRAGLELGLQRGARAFKAALGAALRPAVKSDQRSRARRGASRTTC